MSKPQLFCFTYAGGTKAFFDEIEKDLNGMNLVSFDYAGHGERHREPFYDNFDELADDAFKEVKDRIFADYALFGYSMGSITTAEVLKRIIDADLPLPLHVFLCAHEPHLASQKMNLING